MDNLCYIFVIVISGYFLQFCSKKLYYFLNTLTPIKKVQVFFNDVSPLFYYVKLTKIKTDLEDL